MFFSVLQQHTCWSKKELYHKLKFIFCFLFYIDSSLQLGISSSMLRYAVIRSHLAKMWQTGGGGGILVVQHFIINFTPQTVKEINTEVGRILWAYYSRTFHVTSYGNLAFFMPLPIYIFFFACAFLETVNTIGNDERRGLFWELPCFPSPESLINLVGPNFRKRRCLCSLWIMYTKSCLPWINKGLSQCISSSHW